MCVLFHFHRHTNLENWITGRILERRKTLAKPSGACEQVNNRYNAHVILIPSMNTLCQRMVQKRAYQEYSARDDYRSHVPDYLQCPRTASFRRPPQATTATTLMGQALAT
ncbi:hypothetical protein BLIG_00579 [Bifidobacterium longum subsp. infantis CCUG 52486]|uniref:Uncharacterized protein n=1 Tax=Bifidobacterium longum subsp. infantis CCUG 52486 TaxID=537937 RepID=C5E9L9_BIFLI|nr:hypothetical protein BLIG_00579 [Bifidobacterium longum subsp. infantis CCUG 52486]